MNKQKEKVVPVNLKAAKATHSFRVSIRDKEHFYRLVSWLNENVGKGSEFWTMEGRVLRNIKMGKKVDPLIYIFSDKFEESAILFLSII